MLTIDFPCTEAFRRREVPAPWDEARMINERETCILWNLEIVRAHRDCCELIALPQPFMTVSGRHGTIEAPPRHHCRPFYPCTYLLDCHIAYHNTLEEAFTRYRQDIEYWNQYATTQDD